jgi:coenzyme F420-dependent glucose-6-phosphate dehydrogenase
VLNKANLYDKPNPAIPICIASNGPKVTRLAGKYADSYFVVPGLMSENRSIEEITTNLFSALYAGAKEVGRDPSKIKRCAGLSFSYDEDYDKALAACRKGAANMVPNLLGLNIYDPRWIEALGNLVGEKEYPRFFLIATDIETLIKKIREYARAGFNHVQIGAGGANPEKFIRLCGKELIPAVKDELKE